MVMMVRAVSGQMQKPDGIEVFQVNVRVPRSWVFFGIGVVGTQIDALLCDAVVSGRGLPHRSFSPASGGAFLSTSGIIAKEITLGDDGLINFALIFHPSHTNQ